MGCLPRGWLGECQGRCMAHVCHLQSVPCVALDECKCADGCVHPCVCVRGMWGGGEQLEALACSFTCVDHQALYDMSRLMMRELRRTPELWDNTRKMWCDAWSWLRLRGVAMVCAGVCAAEPDFGGSCEHLGAMRSMALARGTPRGVHGRAPHAVKITQE